MVWGCRGLLAAPGQHASFPGGTWDPHASSPCLPWQDGHTAPGTCMHHRGTEALLEGLLRYWLCAWDQVPSLGLSSLKWKVGEALTPQPGAP